MVGGGTQSGSLNYIFEHGLDFAGTLDTKDSSNRTEEPTAAASVTPQGDIIVTSAASSRNPSAT